MKRGIAALVIVLLASPAFAQFGFIPGLPQIVFDPQALGQTTATALQTKVMVEQILIMAKRLPGMGRYKIPGLPPRPVYVPRSLEALLATLRVILAQGGQLPPWAHPLMASHVQQIDHMDDVLDGALHHVASGRGLDEQLTPMLDALQLDVTSDDPTRSMAASLDAIAVSELVARKQGQASQSMLAALLELEALRMQRARDTDFEALVMRMAFTVMHKVNDGEGLHWTQFRQP